MGTAGAVYADLEVPDFSKAPFSLSGVLLASTPRPTVAQTKSLHAVVPAVPTTLRSFSKTSVVTSMLRVYQNPPGKGAARQPVSLRMTVLDASGAQVQEDSRTLAPEEFAKTQGVDVSFPIVPMNFTPGLHLLRIEATAAGSTLRRDVQFTVK